MESTFTQDDAEWKKGTFHKGHIPMMPPEVQAEVFVSMQDLSKLHEVLLEHGVAVVTNVFSERECCELERIWADDLLSIVDFERTTSQEFLNFLNTSDKKKIIRDWPIRDKAPLGDKFVSYYGLPNGQLAWTVRKDERIQRIFESIFGTKDLCVGMDNVFYDPQPCSKEIPDRERQLPLWPHTDQNEKAPLGGDWEIYQGVVYIWGVNTETSATVVWPGSHKSEPYKRTMSAAQNVEHYCRLPQDMVNEFSQNAYRVPVPRGGLLLWNSRTTHQGWQNGPRLAVPVCYEPIAGRRTEEARQRKLQVLREGGVTTHWASLGIAHFDSGMEFLPSNGIVLKHTAHLDSAKDEGIRKLL